MIVEKYIPMASPKTKNTQAFAMLLDNTGCGAEGCHCSDGHIVSISNGKIGLKVTFTPDEMEHFKKGFTIRA